MKNTELVIFDLDGTLLNTIGDLAVSCNAVLALRGLPQHSYEEYCHFVGNGILRLVERALPEPLRTPENVALVRADFVKYYTEHIDTYTKPYDGIPELVAELRRRGVRLAVASNKFQTGTEKLIGLFFPPETFDVVFGQRPDVPLKPSPAVVEEILARTGTAPERVLYVGDSGVDMETGRGGAPDRPARGAPRPAVAELPAGTGRPSNTARAARPFGAAPRCTFRMSALCRPCVAGAVRFLRSFLLFPSLFCPPDLALCTKSATFVSDR